MASLRSILTAENNRQYPPNPSLSPVPVPPPPYDLTWKSQDSNYPDRPDRPNCPDCPDCPDCPPYPNCPDCPSDTTSIQIPPSYDETTRLLGNTRVSTYRTCVFALMLLSLFTGFVVMMSISPVREYIFST